MRGLVEPGWIAESTSPSALQRNTDEHARVPREDLSLNLWRDALPYNLLVTVTPSYSSRGLENVKGLLIEFFRNSGASVPTPKILVAFHCCA